MEIARRGFASGGNRRRVENRIDERADVFRVTARAEMEAEALVAGRLGDLFEQTSKIRASDKSFRVGQGGEVVRNRLAHLIGIAAGCGDGIDQTCSYAAGN